MGKETSQPHARQSFLFTSSHLSPASHQHLPLANTNKLALCSLEPQPDWTLDDLKKELDVLTRRLSIPSYSFQPSLPVNKPCVSWRDLSTTVDFGRSSKPFRISAYDSESDNSDEESELGEENEEKGRAEGETDTEQPSRTSSSTFLSQAEPLLSRKAETVECFLYELERDRIMRFQEEVRMQHLSLEAAAEEEYCRSSIVLEQVEKLEELKHEMARRIDKQFQRSIAEARDQHLSALQRDHEQRFQVEERKIRREAAAEETRRREIALQEERRRQETAKAEAEVKRKAEIARKAAAAEAERKRQADADAETERKKQADAAAKAALQRAEEEKKQRQQAENDQRDQQTSFEGKKEGLKALVADKAEKLEIERKQKLQYLQAQINGLISNPVLRKDLKNCERNIVKLLQQVAATQEQVGKKSVELLNLLKNPSSNVAFIMSTFASKLMSQIEVQVLKLPSYTFALAQVVVNVSSQIPDLIIPVLAMLNEKCILTVPKYYVFKKSQFNSDKEYYNALGYKEEDGKLESTDSYVERMGAYVMFFAAITQAEGPGGVNPHGLKAGWVWCAQLLNKLPADRVTGSALYSFLKVAGYRLYQVYPNAFRKLVQTILSEFVVKLKTNDPNAKAVVNRLETFLHSHEYLKVPVGRSMAVTDCSSALKA